MQPSLEHCAPSLTSFPRISATPQFLPVFVYGPSAQEPPIFTIRGGRAAGGSRGNPKKLAKFRLNFYV